MRNESGFVIANLSFKGYTTGDTEGTEDFEEPQMNADGREGTVMNMDGQDERDLKIGDGVEREQRFACLFSAATLFIAFILLLAPCTFLDERDLVVSMGAEPANANSLPPAFRKLLPLHKELGKPQPGEWLDKHSESGQTFRQYLKGNPIKVSGKRRVIYIQPIGEFNSAEKKIVDLSAELMSHYFQLPVKVRESLSLDLVPKTARRKRLIPPSEQILTTYVLGELLRPRLPKDAVVCIGFTTSDLWPGEGWNYVFGQASFSDRVGIWSINRYGDPASSDEAFKLCLLRTLKTATHETGHMFSLAHCTSFECNMCGSNHLAEADRRPLEVCPHCLAKLCYATGADPIKRFEKLIEFYKAHDLAGERDFCEKSLSILRKK